ncbi:hypothetical protein ACFVYR_26605 [Streptomyces sp. NPDC058284]|uniref:hypothetical protein n=1 Tax=unclassified Streptomyces TaxID=2593676 RepID=UPI00364DDDBD
MHGPGYASPHQPPPPPGGSGGTRVTWRVVFVALAVMTCGMLGWAPMLRLAFVTRKAHDWLLFTVVTALDITALVLIGMDPGEEEFQEPGSAGMIVLLCTMTAAVAYYLFADIRHFGRLSADRQPRFTGCIPPQPQAHAQAHAQLQTRPEHGYGYPQQPTPPPPPPARPAPARINQVRAELDELSDYLRKQEGGS